ncbi:MAG TPA: hypothetical protein VIR02_00540 [Anaerolineales bacterium]|jgi:hypothetical protein
MTELELLRHKVQELEERLAQLEPPAPHLTGYRNVTDECEHFTGWWIGNKRVLDHRFVCDGYRLRKVKVWQVSGQECLIIEEKR